jgi:hypothetical protein
VLRKKDNSMHTYYEILHNLKILQKMKTLKLNVETFEKMTVIPNIQTMQGIIKANVTPFDDLIKKPIEELRLMQDQLIPLYNDAVRNKTN